MENHKDNELNGCHLLEIVNEINYDFYEKFNPDPNNPNTDDYEYPTLDLVSNGDSHIMNYMGVCIWSSENEEREWIEENNGYEPLKEFIQKQIKNLIKKLDVLKS